MGFRTVVIINNDALHAIKDDPGFAKKLATAIQSFSFSRGPVGITADGGKGIYIDAARVVHHDSGPTTEVTIEV